MKYSRLADLYESLESTTKRLEKTSILSDFLKNVDKKDISRVVLLVQGRVFPVWDPRKLGVAAQIVLKSLSLASGLPLHKIESLWKETGDLGDTAEKVVMDKQQATLFSQDLTDKKVFSNLRKLASLEGKGTVSNKLQLIAELLTSAKPKEAKYIVRTILEDLRVGVAEGTLRDAILWANFGDKIGLNYNPETNDIGISDREKYNFYLDIVQSAYDVSNDFAVVAERAAESLESLKNVSLTIGNPVKAMLAIKAKDIDDAFDRVGRPCAFEYKYDGFRMQIHKQGNNVQIFTRRLENVTRQFPDVVESVKDHVSCESCILDSEAVGFDRSTGNYLPFQNISQRIKRKYDIHQISKDFPVELNIFDIIYLNGESLINKEFSQRRKLLESVVTQKHRLLCLSKQIITDSKTEAESFYEESLKVGNEGVMAKSLKAPYKPGARVGYMVKVKPVMEPLDLVIVKAEWGEGKRSKWLSSFTLACIDDSGSFLEIGKVGTGIKEKSELGVSFEELTNLLKPLIIKESGKEAIVKPKIVVEVNYEEIQKSPTYSSGYALRFPRLSRVRDDKAVDEISTLSMVEEYYLSQ